VEERKKSWSKGKKKREGRKKEKGKEKEKRDRRKRETDGRPSGNRTACLI
jgi:hypothetical protein